jgi:hypothetical protein
VGHVGRRHLCVPICHYCHGHADPCLCSRHVACLHSSVRWRYEPEEAEEARLVLLRRVHLRRRRCAREGAAASGRDPGAEKKSLRSAASSSARLWSCVPAFVSRLITEKGTWLKIGCPAPSRRRRQRRRGCRTRSASRLREISPRRCPLLADLHCPGTYAVCVAQRAILIAESVIDSVPTHSAQRGGLPNVV